MRNNKLIHEGKSAGRRPPVLPQDLNRTNIEVNWWETETYTIYCRRFDIGDAVPRQELYAHLFLAQPVRALEQACPPPGAFA